MPVRAFVETVRGFAMFAYYLGGAVLVTPLAARALRRGGRAEALGLVVRIMRRAFRIGGVEVSIEGRQNLPDGAYVLLHNEASLVDLMVVHGVVMVEFAEASLGAEVWRMVPGAPTWEEVLGIRTFQRGDRDQAEQWLGFMADHARRGGRVSMSGEGRLSPDGTVQRFKRGGALIAIRAGVPLVPMSFTGGFEICPAGSVRVRPGTVRLRFGEPMSTSGLTDEDAPDLARRARDVVASMVDADRAGLLDVRREG